MDGPFARLLVAVALLAFGAAGPGALSANVCGAGTGETADCDAAPAPTAPTHSPRPSLAIGNPVDLATGNKRQTAIDYASHRSPLAFTRHYNSANADANFGLGHGWQSGYDTRLLAEPDGDLVVLEASGHRTRFRALAPGEEDGADDVAPDPSRSGRSGGAGGQEGDARGRDPAGTAADTAAGSAPAARWEARSPSDGFIVREGERHLRVLPDGRRVLYHGSWPIRVDFPGGEHLALRYRDRRLVAISDHLGQTLELGWTPGTRALGRYDEGDGDPTQPGHLERLTLPDGREIRYRYDGRQNLVGVDFPGGGRRVYHHEDPAWPSHLSGITDPDGLRETRWRYDGHGRVEAIEDLATGETVTLELPPPAPTLRRADRSGGRDGPGPDAPGSGVPGPNETDSASAGSSASAPLRATQVRDGRGREALYRWYHDAADDRFVLVEATGEACARCPPTGVRYEYRDDLALARERHADGHELRYGYDARGRPLTIDRHERGGETAPSRRLRFFYAGSADARPRRVLVAGTGTLDGAHPIDYRAAAIAAPHGAGEPLIGWRSRGAVYRSGLGRSACVAACTGAGAAIGGTVGGAIGTGVGGAGGTIALPGGGTVGGAVIGQGAGTAGGSAVGAGIGWLVGQVVCSESGREEEDDAPETADGSDEATAQSAPPGDPEEPPECEGIRRDLKEALYRDKRVHGSGGSHGFLRRAIEQMCGLEGPGTSGWLQHHRQLNGMYEKLRRLVRRAYDNECVMTNGFGRRERDLLGEMRGDRWSPDRIVWRGRDAPQCEQALDYLERRRFDQLLDILTRP